MNQIFECEKNSNSTLIASQLKGLTISSQRPKRRKNKNPKRKKGRKMSRNGQAAGLGLFVPITSSTLVVEEVVAAVEEVGTRPLTSPRRC